MIWAAIIIPLFRPWRERGNSPRLINPRSRGKRGQPGLFFSCVQVLLEELQSFLTAGKRVDSQGSHPHSRKQEHWNYLRKTGAFVEGTLQRTETPLGQKPKSRGLGRLNLGRWFVLPHCSHGQWCSPSVESQTVLGWLGWVLGMSLEGKGAAQDVPTPFPCSTLLLQNHLLPQITPNKTIPGETTPATSQNRPSRSRNVRQCNSEESRTMVKPSSFTEIKLLHFFPLFLPSIKPSQWWHEFFADLTAFLQHDIQD